MSETKPERQALWPEVAEVAASTATVQERAAEHLQKLERILPFDAGWLAVRDPERHIHVPVATTGPAEALVAYFGRPEADEEVDLLGLNRRRLPMLDSEIPIPLTEVRAWAEHLLPAGFRQGLAAALFTTSGRHVGFLSLLSADPSRPSPADRRVVAAVTTAIADELDRTRDIAETARIVANAGAGVVLTRGGDVLPLPGLPDDPLLAPGSRTPRVAADELADSGAYVAFLAPLPGAGGDRLVRVTALDFARPDLDHLSAAVLLSPPGDLHGLTLLDLRVLGLVVEGVTGVPALAGALHVAVDAVADSLGRSLVALGTSDLTAATVRALRNGLRIPSGVTGPT
ncbi:helix-turn-helix transcriptional regulator [Trujillonella humicola]|uniref:helix-turn-helix transcriptional regulator n=1 Tax=Trujillonella humicola TaxID=3383699 RepID=UPI0039068FDF